MRTDRRGFLGALAALVLVRPAAPRLTPAALLYNLQRDPYAFIARTTWPMLLDDHEVHRAMAEKTWVAWSRP